MATYLEKVQAAQRGIDDFYRLLNIYNISRLNNGWIGTEESCSNTSLDKFKTYFNDKKFVKKNNTVTATLFDIPMNSQGYDKKGRYGAGIPSDIGFCRNVNTEEVINFKEGNISETARNWYSICYGKDKFVAVTYGANYFAYSTDGITWTESTISETNRMWRSICYGDNKFVAVAYDTNYFAYSYDGITWTEGTISETVRNWYSVCYGKDKFVAVSYQSDNKFAYSYDGITWTEGTIGTANNWTSICYGKDKFVAVASTSKTASFCAYSYDGITWTEGTISETPRYFNGVCYGKDKFVALVYQSKYFAYSYDGINWIEGTTCNTSGHRILVCYGNGKFVAPSRDSNTFIYSYDGINWIEGTIGNTSGAWVPVCYGNGKFIIIARQTNLFATGCIENHVLQHEPLYQVTAETTLEHFASITADTTVGGKIKTTMNNVVYHNILKIYPNGSTEGLEVAPINDNYWNENFKFMIKPIDGAILVLNKFKALISTSDLLAPPKSLTVWITKNCGKFLKSWKYQTT